MFTLVLRKYSRRSNSDLMYRRRNGFTGDLVLTVRSLDRALQITCRTIMDCICSECARTCFTVAGYSAPMWEAYSRICAFARTHRRRSTYLPSLRALLSNMPGMPLPNMPSAKWSVKIPAGLSDFTRAQAFSFFRTRRDRSERTGTIAERTWDG